MVVEMTVAIGSAVYGTPQMTSYAADDGSVEMIVSEIRRRSLGYETINRRSM